MFPRALGLHGPLVLEPGVHDFASGAGPFSLTGQRDERVHYCVDLKRAAIALDDPGCACLANGALLAPPSSFLVRPEEAPDDAPFRLSMTTSPGSSFASGLASPRPNEFEATLDDLPRAPYSIFGDLEVQTIELPNQRLDVAFAPGAIDLGRAAITAWIASSARVVSSYLGAPPLPRTLVIITPVEGRDLTYALTLGNGGASILAPIGEHITKERLESAWEMVHELLHVAFPNLPNEQAWLEEGEATYIEPLARAQAGTSTAEDAFARFHRRMQFGLPGPDDRGLDATPTWGRKYWGGALFCLLADVALREASGGERSLQTQLAQLAQRGGNVARRQSIELVLATLDEGTGAHVVADLYARVGKAPGAMDLEGTWKKLGVVASRDGVRFDDTAPLTAMRKAMTTKR